MPLVAKTAHKNGTTLREGPSTLALSMATPSTVSFSRKRDGHAGLVCPTHSDSGEVLICMLPFRRGSERTGNAGFGVRGA